ncbi:metal-dependent hydrolase [Nannocystis sp.]|uniref:metal-dependent hydrolase n=1 Tax=Nannocystis sp. TaxID=1962667 RepID=UPI00242963D6|nr:metal-dependent hydrolase [Nannocystis sp.]MBK7824029.1 metal-dependent hydrolase [Nannocystis sp.]MBK9755044.1 metal-dependent hydrolase [Nannocystis sp.]
MTTTQAPRDLGEIRPRVMGFEFDDSIPRYWVADAVVPTHMGNALHLIFPMGERFFVRAVKHYADQIDDPELKAQIKGFYAQEGRHAHEHEKVFLWMERQGYDIRRFLAIYKKIAFLGIERLSPHKLRLATTAALEHYTAIMAENALEHGLLERVHPGMRELLCWHACEEIEHKAVAFDVLQRVDASYALRVAGMFMATTTLVGFWFLGASMLLRQEKGLGLREILRQLRASMQQNPLGRRVFLRGMREYLRRDFHPWQTDNLALARSYLARIERAAA